MLLISQVTERDVSALFQVVCYTLDQGQLKEQYVVLEKEFELEEKDQIFFINA